MSLLVLFNQQQGGSPPARPDVSQNFDFSVLNIQDNETRQSVAVIGFSKGTTYVQGLFSVLPPLVFYGVGDDLSAGETSGALLLNGFPNIVLKANFSDAGATANIRFLYEDQNGLIVPGELKTISAIDVVENGKYVGNMVTAETFGAHKIKVLVKSITVGTVSLFLAEA